MPTATRNAESDRLAAQFFDVYRNLVNIFALSQTRNYEGAAEAKNQAEDMLEFIKYEIGDTRIDKMFDATDYWIKQIIPSSPSKEYIENAKMFLSETFRMIGEERMGLRTIITFPPLDISRMTRI